MSCALTWSFPSCGKQRRITEASFCMWVLNIRKLITSGWLALNKANVMFLKIPVSISVVVYDAQIYIWLSFVFILLRIKSTAFCYDSENVDQLTYFTRWEFIWGIYTWSVFCFVYYVNWFIYIWPIFIGNHSFAYLRVLMIW